MRRRRVRVRLRDELGMDGLGGWGAPKVFRLTSLYGYHVRLFLGGWDGVKDRALSIGLEHTITIGHR